MRPGAVESWVQEQALLNFHRSLLLLPESVVRIDNDKDEYLYNVFSCPEQLNR